MSYLIEHKILFESIHKLCLLIGPLLGVVHDKVEALITHILKSVPFDRLNNIMDDLVQTNTHITGELSFNTYH